MEQQMLFGGVYMRSLTSLEIKLTSVSVKNLHGVLHDRLHFNLVKTTELKFHFALKNHM